MSRLECDVTKSRAGCYSALVRSVRTASRRALAVLLAVASAATLVSCGPPTELDVGPKGSVSLTGEVGEAESSHATLTVATVGDKDCAWTATAEDPWLVVQPANGKTPGTLEVWADLKKASSNLSGKVTVTCPSAGKGTPWVVPVSLQVLNPEAVRKQMVAKSEMAQSELQRLGQDIAEKFARRSENPTPDGLVQDMKALKADTELAARRVTTQLDDLVGFLDQNQAYATRFDFQKVRASIEEMRKRASDLDAHVADASAAVQDVRANVDAASGDWVVPGIAVHAGDLLVFEASGSWSLGMMAGVVGPGGRGGFDGYSLNAKYPHGCLLVRIGDTIVAGGAKSGILGVSGDGGAVTMRCNDKKATDNGGSIAVRLVLAPLSRIRTTGDKQSPSAPDVAGESKRRLSCMNSLAQLGQVFILQSQENRGKAQKYSGAAMWLSYRKNATAITRGHESILICPNDGDVSPPKTDADTKLWDDVDLDHAPRSLCSYAARDFVKFPLNATNTAHEAIGACIHHKGGAVVVFAAGDVQWVSLKDLGLASDDEKTVGPDSKSPLLRVLRYGDGSTH